MAKSPARPAKKEYKKQTKQPAHPVPATEPDWDPQKALPAPPSAPAGSTDKAELLLQELANTLNRSDQPLDARVQNILSKVSIKPPDPSQQMQSANSRLKNARENLQRAKEAKQNLHKSWRAFLADAVKRWETHSAKFTQEDEELQVAINAATQSFQEAKDYFEASREMLVAHDSKEIIQEISDDELLQDATPAVAEDIATMLTSLTRLRDRQEEAHQGESAPKKARTEEPGDAGKTSLDSAASHALTPFGGGGK